MANTGTLQNLWQASIQGSSWERLMMILRPAIAALALLSATTAQAASSRISPPAEAECQALAQRVSALLGLKITSRTEQPSKDAFIVETRGDACLLGGKGHGLSITFEQADTAMRTLVAGWKPMKEVDADGPMSTIAGFAKASQRLIYSLEREPPKGKCEDVIIGDCKVPAKQWEWSLALAAYNVAGR